jgi:hypothetical protein
MATLVSDVIVPEIFNPYVQQRTAELSAIRTSGIAAAVPGVEVPSGGKTINMPYWNDLTESGDVEVLSDTVPLTPAKITADQDVAAILVRGKAWEVNELAGAFAGSDPMGAIANRVAEYWARQEQKIVLSILKGVFAAGSMSGSLLDISGESGNDAIITGESLIDAISLLGDAGQGLTGILCHSAVMYDLAKKKLLDPKITTPGTEVAPEFNTYLGRRVIADDGAPVAGGIYTTYLFGAGAIGYAEGSYPTPTETERDALAGVDRLANRRRFIFHPRGVAWIGTSAGQTPNNVELGTGASWTRKYEKKNIRIIALIHKIGALSA